MYPPRVVTRFSSRTLSLLGWTALAALFVAPLGCAGLIGLDVYEKGETSSGGTDTGGSSSGGSDTGGFGGEGTGGATGGAGAGGSGTGGSGTGGSGDECDGPEDCDDGNACTADSCVATACQHISVPLATECEGGVCNGSQSAPECVRCVDDEGGTLQDSGCSEGAPVCVDDDGAPTCSGCSGPDDCDDGNACTNDSCTGMGLCANVKRANGSACGGGFCDAMPTIPQCRPCADTQPGNGLDNGCSGGTPVCDQGTCRSCVDSAPADGVDDGCSMSAPFCVGGGAGSCVECVNASDCDADGVSCTNAVCNNGSCAQQPDDGLCMSSGDVCNPNRCDAMSGCQLVNIETNPSLLTNGSFETGDAPWVETGLTIRTNTVPTNPTDVNAHAGTWVAWLGGTDGETSVLRTTLAIPAGTQSVTVNFYYQVRTRGTDGDADDSGSVFVTNVGEAMALVPLLSFNRSNAGTSWTLRSQTFDATAYAGTSKDLVFRAQSDSSPSNSYLSFYVDSVTVTARVCN